MTFLIIVGIALCIIASWLVFSVITFGICIALIKLDPSHKAKYPHERAKIYKNAGTLIMLGPIGLVFVMFASTIELMEFVIKTCFSKPCKCINHWIQNRLTKVNEE